LERGADLTDFEVPWISLGIAGALAIRDLYSGDTNLSCAVTNVLTDTAGRVVGGATGEHVTAVVGTLFFGPAGGVVGAGIGAIAGGIAGRSVARAARSLLTGKEQEAVRTRIRALAQQAAEHLPRKDEAWAEKESAIADAMVGDEGNRARIREYTLSRMRSDRAYHQNKRSEICRYTRGDNANSDVLEATSRLMVLIARAGVHPHHIQEGLRQLGECATELAKKRRRLRLG